MKAGIGQKNVTPPGLDRGIPLAGVRGEDVRRALNALDDLYVRVAWLRDNRDVILINGDFLLFPEDMCSRIRARLGVEFRVDEGCIVFNATHSHSAPHLGGGLFDGGVRDEGYRAFLEERIVETVEEAFLDLRDSALSYARTRCSVGVNRRKEIIDLNALKGLRIRQVVANRPNFGGPVDRDLSLVRITRGGEPAALLINYGCHASTFLGASISADFPGRIAIQWARATGRKTPVFFLQGFAGDVRPRVVISYKSLLRSPKELLKTVLVGRGFDRRGSEEELNRIGAQFVKAICSIGEGEYQEIESGLDVREEEITLPLGEAPTTYELLSFRPTKPGEKEWQAHMLQEPPRSAAMKMKIKRVDLGREHSLLCVPAEVFTEYSLLFKEILAPRKVMPLGYTDGLVGYIPTEEGLERGGYEVERAYRVFGMPSPFSKGVEKAFVEGVRSLYDA